MTADPALMRAEIAGWNVRVPAGTYYLGDPYQVTDTGTWRALLATSGQFTRPVACARGRQAVAFTTARGGTFTDKDGYEYDTVAGLLGLIPVDLTTITERDDVHGGRIVTFTKPTTARTDNLTGIMRFGEHEDEIEIDTTAPLDDDTQDEDA